jgi:hypothetical protein
MEAYWNDDVSVIGDDAEYTEMAAGRVHAGKDNVMALLRRWYEEDYEDASGGRRSAVIGEGFAAAEYIFTGTNRATGRSVEFPFVVF